MARAQTLPELFAKAKAEVKAESWADALATLGALEAEASKPGNESAQKQLAGPLAFYRGVCSANLGKSDEAVASFAAFQKLQPGSTIDSAVYSRKAVAAFEKAQKDAAERAPSLAEAYKDFQPPADAKDRYPADQYWGEGAVRWIMTDSEKAAWSGITEPNARVTFVEEFWTARAARPGADGRTYRQEFERRVAFADENLAVDPEQLGSLTDRGMVFVLMGPPTWAGRKPMRTGEDASDSAGMSTVGSQDAANAEKGLKASGGRSMSSSKLATQSTKFGNPNRNALDSDNNRMEVWHYRRELLPSGVPYQQVDFQFVTKKGYGMQVLQRETESVNTLDAAKSRRQIP
ncbi:MAG: GWxTD domain-containing protein [Thermoanaerobaculia bacterium]